MTDWKPRPVSGDDVIGAAMGAPPAAGIGAMFGIPFGPIGMLVGACIGGIAGSAVMLEIQNTMFGPGQ